MITDLGMARAMTDRVIAELPPTVTLSFDAQAPVIAAWGARARQDGHEILLQLPMEPFDYPNSDPGPDTLLTSLPDGDNLVRLLKLMRRATGYVGVTTIYGSRMTTDATKFSLVLRTGCPCCAAQRRDGYGGQRQRSRCDDDSATRWRNAAGRTG